jgi:hypothetical protein
MLFPLALVPLSHSLHVFPRLCIQMVKSLLLHTDSHAPFAQRNATVLSYSIVGSHEPCAAAGACPYHLHAKFSTSTASLHQLSQPGPGQARDSPLPSRRWSQQADSFLYSVSCIRLLLITPSRLAVPPLLSLSCPKSTIVSRTPTTMHRRCESETLLLDKIHLCGIGRRIVWTTFTITSG